MEGAEAAVQSLPGFATQRNGKEPGKVATAIARELSGFVWAIACAVMAEQKTK